MASTLVCDLSHRVLCDLDDAGVKLAQLLAFYLASEAVWPNPRAPEDFVRHPISNAGETFLHEQHRFNRGTLPPDQECLYYVSGERF